MKKIAWLLDKGDEPFTDEYRTMLPDANIDFFDTPAQVLEHLNNGYDLFILGLVCPPEPYGNAETNYGLGVGLRLADDIRKNTRTKDSPVLISSPNASFYRGRLKAKKLPYIERPFQKEKLLEAVNTLTSR